MLKFLAKGVAGLFGLIVAIGYVFGGGMDRVLDHQMERIDRQAAKEMARINKQVVVDAVDQFEIAMKHGNPIDACVQAGFVSASLLQAKAEDEYRQFKDIQNKVCAKAGMPPL